MWVHETVSSLYFSCYSKWKPLQLLMTKKETEVISCSGESTASKTTKCLINERLKITSFWDLMPCRQVPTYAFGGSCRLHPHDGIIWRHQVPPKHWCIMYQTSQHYIPENHNLNTHCQGNFKSHVMD
jgi:hypothetical protein